MHVSNRLDAQYRANLSKSHLLGSLLWCSWSSEAPPAGAVGHFRGSSWSSDQPALSSCRFLEVYHRLVKFFLGDNVGLIQWCSLGVILTENALFQHLPILPSGQSVTGLEPWCSSQMSVFMTMHARAQWKHSLHSSSTTAFVYKGH